MSVSDKPCYAPIDYRTRPPHEEDNMPWSEIRTGPGWGTARACQACGNAAGNLCIFYSYSCGRNGDATATDEIWCSACGKYSTFCDEL
jgi:hypothetical protein